MYRDVALAKQWSITPLFCGFRTMYYFRGLAHRHPVVFIKQGMTPTDVVRKRILSIVVEVPQCIVVTCLANLSCSCMYIEFSLLTPYT